MRGTELVKLIRKNPAIAEGGEALEDLSRRINKIMHAEVCTSNGCFDGEYGDTGFQYQREHAPFTTGRIIINENDEKREMKRTIRRSRAEIYEDLRYETESQ